MFKALTAAAAITVCCLGNEFPAKAQLSPGELQQIRQEIRLQQFERDTAVYFEQRQQRQNQIFENYINQSLIQYQ